MTSKHGFTQFPSFATRFSKELIIVPVSHNEILFMYYVSADCELMRWPAEISGQCNYTS